MKTFFFSLIVGLLFSTSPLFSQEKQELKLSSVFSIPKLLDTAKEQKIKVEVVLKNGKSYKGFVGDVGNNTCVITQLDGKNFFDALILVEEIVAVEVQTRK